MSPCYLYFLTGIRVKQPFSLIHKYVLKLVLLVEVVCVSIARIDCQGGYRPAELKYQSHRDQWHCLESCLTLNTQCHIECKEGVPIQDLVKVRGGL